MATKVDELVIGPATGDQFALSRRDFLRLGAGAAAVAGVLPPAFARAVHAADADQAANPYGSDTTLVVIQMQGGNDGLNTVVPYGMDGYHKVRSAIGIQDGQALQLTDRVALHPKMTSLFQRYQAGQVAIVQGVGYPKPDLSHFRSTDIWNTGVPDAYTRDGWLADYLAVAANPNPLAAVSVTGGLAPSLDGRGTGVPAMSSIQAYQFRTETRYPGDRDQRLAYINWVYGLGYPGLEQLVANTGASALSSVQQVQEGAAAYQSGVKYPNFALANSLKTVAQLIAANLGTRVFYVSFGGFDTHSNQPNTQSRLLEGLSDSVEAFMQDLEQMGKADPVLLMTWSEFGRRVQENGSQGTDHGTAAPLFIIGHQVHGGLYGDYPSLTDLDGNKNLKYTVDFRSVYATVIENWLGTDEKAALGARYDKLGFV